MWGRTLEAFHIPQNHAFIYMNDSFVVYKTLGLFSFSLENTNLLSYFSHPVLLLKNLLICVPLYIFFCFVLEAFYICFLCPWLPSGDFFKLAYQLVNFSSDVSVLIFVFCILIYCVISAIIILISNFCWLPFVLLSW